MSNVAHILTAEIAANFQRLVDMPLRNQESWSFDTFDTFKLRIDTEDALEVIEYMKQLAEVAPPDISTMDWERRIHYFISGQVSMAYCWTMRAARFEHELSSRVARRVAYIPPPSRRMHRVSATVGGFLLTIPSSVGLSRQKQIMNAIE